MSIKRNTFGQGQKVEPVKGSDVVPVGDLDNLVDNWLLSHHVPASVVVDQDMEILQFRGSTGLFLEPSPGKASLNLAKMARPSLVFELRNVIHKARKSSQPASKTGLEVVVNKKIHYVNIQAVPITNSANHQLFLILFEELKENVLSNNEGSGDAGKRNHQLEAELAVLRQDMHSIIEEQEANNEELQSANEEIVSNNEELQSINEELETSKEEIESANEELQTINQELQVRNDLLTESYEYSEAILSTINEATLVLDNQLRIKSANKAFYKIFHADPRNTEGSMIYELGNGQLGFEGFRDLMYEVITRDVSIKGYEVKIKLTEVEERTMLIHARKVVQHQKQTILLVFEDITEHRKVQNLLHERQRWFEELVDNATALIWVAQTDGKIDFLNKAWLDFTGRPSEKEKNRTFTESIHPDDRGAYLDISAASIKNGSPFSCEYRLRQRDGEYRWVLENTKPMLSPDGQLTGYIGTCTDVHLQKTLTEQLNHHVDQRTRELKEANAELEIANRELTQTADRLQSVLNGVLAAVTLMEVVRDSDQGEAIDFITSVYNDRALELSGLTALDIRRKTLLELYPQLKESGLFDLYLKVLMTGEPAYQEISNPRPPVEETLAFLITRQVDQKGIVVTILDITKRKQAETKLIQTAESLQAVLDSSPASIGFFKAVYNESSVAVDFNLVVCNHKFSNSFHKEVNQLVGHMASNLCSKQQLDRMKRVLVNSHPYYEEIFMEHEQKWMGVSLTRHDHGIAITQLDITSLKQAQHEQDELIRQLKGSYEMIQSLSVMKEYVQHRGSFLRSTFHDLRGSFGIISGAATLLDMMDTQEDRAKTLDMIQRNLGQVTQMMNQLLDYSRLESGQETLETSQFDASAMLTQLCEGSNPIAASKNLWIKFEGPQNLSVQGDMVKVRRIAQNLILNALRYTSEGGVTVSWDTCSSAGTNIESVWQFTVQDTGPGISKKLLEKLLNPNFDETQDFDQTQELEDENAREIILTEPNISQGEGIGLFIVKRLCELLRAEIQINSNAGSGSMFRIILPRSY